MSDLMVVTALKCWSCNNPLSGGLDTFGAIGQEQCWNCFIHEYPIFQSDPEEDLEEILDQLEEDDEEISNCQDALDEAEYQKDESITKLKEFVEAHPEYKKSARVKEYL